MRSMLRAWRKRNRPSRTKRGQRARLFERLEPRVVLNAAPIGKDDPWYYTDEDTDLTVGTSDTTLLDNDWDPEGSSLTATIVDNPANGSVSNFSGTAGTFTYSPDLGFTGVDTFTYDVSDGTNDSNLVTVSIAVGGHFGPRTNLEEMARGGNLMTGELELYEPLTPGLALVYDSTTLPQPIIVLETFLRDDSSVPDAINAQLTFNSSAGTDYGYSTTGLSAGDSLRFALQHDATSLSSGRYDYSVELTSDISSTLTDHTYSGHYDLVNRGSSTHPFGRGWQLVGLDELVIDTDGVLWVQSDGDALWFEEDGSGGFDPAVGDLSFSTLEDNGDDTYTLTDKHGIEAHFDDTGKLTSREDRNGNTTTYTYTSGLLTKITDKVNRDTTFTYTSGQLTSISDFDSRSATLTYDGSGRLTKITQPDPDGAGAKAAPETEFAYDATSHQLTKVTNPLDDETDYEYGSHDRLKKITFDDNNTWQLTALQTIGLPTGDTGNSLTAADPEGSITNERAKTSEFKTDRFGHLIERTDELDNVTTLELNNHGQLVKLTEADPDGTGGSLQSPVTIFGYDDKGNQVYRKNPNGWSRTATYTTTFNQVATATDELSNSVSYTYDTNGNLTKFTDGDDYEWTFTYNSDGNVTKATSPDPDGLGPLTASDTEFAYDTKQRLTTTTKPDDTTVTIAYDTADNQTSITDERSKVTSFTYDDLNRLTSTTDRESATIDYDYDAVGQVTKITDALDNETDYEYNSRGWRTKVTQPDPDGAGSLVAPVTTYSYDAAGNVTGSVEVEFEGLVQLTYTYDDAGRRTKQDGPGTLGSVVTEYDYDNLGRVTKITDPMDNETTYEYDAAGNQTKIMQVESASSPPDGPTYQFSYYANEELAVVTDPRGYQTSYTYNARGLVERISHPDPDGTGSMGRPYEHHTYDNMGRLTEVQDQLLRRTKYEYDSRDRVTKLTLPDPDFGGPLTASTTTTAYDNAGRVTSVTDPLSRVTSYTYDDEGRVTKETAPDPDSTGPLAAPETEFAYNDNGLLTSMTDPLDGVTSYEYDNLGRVTKITEPDPDGAGSQTSPITTYAYNAQGKLDKITDPIGRDTTFGYDDLGRRTDITDDSSNKTSYEFNDLNLLTKVTLPDPDGAGSQTAPVTSYTYDEFQRLTQITDAESGLTKFTYDDAGNLLTLTDPVNNVTTFAYDGLGRVTMETNELSDSRSFYYDAGGRLSRRVDRNERILQFAYDNLNRTTKEEWFSNGTPVPTITIATTTDGGVTDEVQRVGFSDDMEMLDSGDFTLTFDSQTTSTITWNATAATVQTALEALSNIDEGDISVTKSQDTAGTQEWTLTFAGDLADTNVAQTTVDSSNVTGMGTITDIEATDTAGGTNNNEVQTVTLANEDGGTFRLAFDGETTAGIAHNAAASAVETALEDLNAVNNVTVTGSAGGPWTVTFVGTHAGVNEAQMNGDAASLTSGTEVREITYTYDKASQLTDASDPDSTYEYTYDNLGRMLTVDNDGTSGVPDVVLTSAYDANGNRTSLSAEIDTTDDFLNTYTYDALNRLTRVDQEGQTGGNTVNEKRVDFAYNAIGLFTSITRYNDTDGNSGDEISTSSYTYDTLGRLTDLAYKNGGTNLFTPYEWTYDSLSSAGLQDSVSEDPRVQALSAGAVFTGLGRVTEFVSADGTTDYTYDDTSQLTGADHTYQTDESYTYDANGNRTMTGYTTGDNNQLTNDGTYSYEYDDEGNRTKRTHDTTSDVTEYDWDYRNRLTKVTEKDDMGTTTKVVEYTYDVFNRRIGKEVDTTSPFNMADAVIERYVYDDLNGVTSIDGGNVVLDFVDPDGTGSTEIDLERRYLYGNAVDQILAQEDVTESTTSADRVLWPLVDNLGTVRDLAKNDETLGEHYKYDSYGKVASGDTSVTRYLYTSRELDADTGLQGNRARWYDAEVGRWISEDPKAFEAEDTNISRYVRNSVKNAIDPSGLQPPNSTTIYVPYATPISGASSVEEVHQLIDNVTIFDTDQGYVPDVTDTPYTYDFWDGAIDYGYGFSDFATLGIAPAIRHGLNYTTGMGDHLGPNYFSTPYNWGLATPPAIVIPASFLLPSGIGAPVFGVTSIGGWTFGSATAPGATTTLWNMPILTHTVPVAWENGFVIATETVVDATVGNIVPQIIAASIYHTATTAPVWGPVAVWIVYGILDPTPSPIESTADAIGTTAGAVYDHLLADSVEDLVIEIEHGDR